jgi:aspartate kinase
MMSFLVLKFGGTSVGSPQRIKDLIKLTADERPKVVVLSAMSGTTNALVGICEALYSKEQEVAVKRINDLRLTYEKVVSELFETATGLQQGQELIAHHFQYIQAFTQDLFTSNEEKAILAQGELLSTALFHFYLSEKNIPSVLLPALNFMRIDAEEEPDMPYIEKYLAAEMALQPKANLFITQGYICRNAFGEIDNLKRGGSDYSASIIGAALLSPEIQIWTDIDGMHNNDPRIVSNTKPVSTLSFDEAAELAYFGAKILHPTCILPAQKKNIPVRLKNTMQPAAPGTLIAHVDSTEGVKAIAAKDGITAISIKSARMLLAYGFLRAVFEIFERHKTPIDMITTSEVAVSVTIDNSKNLSPILAELEQFAQVEVDSEQTIICIVGHLPKETSGFACKVMEALKDIPLRMVSYGGSANNISVLVNSKHKNQALQALNTGLFPSY